MVAYDLQMASKRFLDKQNGTINRDLYNHKSNKP